MFTVGDTKGVEVDAAKESARGAAERLLMALDHGTTEQVALAAAQAYLLVGRLAVLADAESQGL